ncbi:ExeM/NucH family extracellular endonuclease [Acinetobacter sp. 161(2023)]|uniref:ExeM/NucH family extracellular endonuclease n=1 Tax=Acinetobacter sp. 161(2023) TaxID=3098768 RepID=UPI00300867D2
MKTFQLNRLSTILMVLGSTTALSHTAYAQLMFSQYIDGNSNNKGLQVYNPDGTAVNLTDYQIKQFANGEATPNLTVTLQGTLSSKAKYLVGHSALKTTLGDQVNQVANLAFNGDDAIVLYYKGTAIDRFGKVGERPDGGWGSTVKSSGNSFARKQTNNNVTNIDPATTFDLDSSWTAWSNRNDFSAHLGANTAPTEPPKDTLSCSATTTPIADVRNDTQGSVYTVRGVITADYRYDGGYNGFFMQTADTKAKASVSNAIFVYAPSTGTAKGGQVGEEVVVKGTLGAFSGQLQLANLTADVLTCNTAASTWVAAKPLELPFSALTTPSIYAGELVKFNQTLTVSENYNYGRYGSVSLSPNRLFMPTQLYSAGSAEAKALAELNERSELILDDGYNTQNRTPWLPLQFDANHSLRTGAQLKNVEGIMQYSNSAWRVQPILGRNNIEVIADSNKRPETVVAKNSKQVRVSSFNVLNYDNGLAKGFPTERGATSKAEFDKQHAKIVKALKTIDADVYGLMEIANNGYSDKSAVAYLTSALGADWKYVIPKDDDKLGTDAIAVAIIYNSKRVKPVNDPVTLDFADSKTRKTIAQSFQPISGGKIFTVIPQHLKSKSCGTGNDAATGENADQKDGQSCWNPLRVNSVQKLIAWIAQKPTKVEKPNVLLVGDMNSYAKEDPILTFEKAGFKPLLTDEKVGEGKNGYSYVFGVGSNTDGNGGSGNLDHVLADADLYPLVKKTFAWHINSDEPAVLDYNEEYKTDEQKAAFYADNAFRSSDHDPIIVDLDLNDTSTAEAMTSKSSSGSFDAWSILSLLGLGLWAARMRKQK